MLEYSIMSWIIITRITHESGRPQAAARVVLLVLSHDMLRKGLLKTLVDIELFSSLQPFMCFFMLLYRGSPLSCDNYFDTHVQVSDSCANPYNTKLILKRPRFTRTCFKSVFPARTSWYHTSEHWHIFGRRIVLSITELVFEDVVGCEVGNSGWYCHYSVNKKR